MLREYSLYVGKVRIKQKSDFDSSKYIFEGCTPFHWRMTYLTRMEERMTPDGSEKLEVGAALPPRSEYLRAVAREANATIKKMEGLLKELKEEMAVLTAQTKDGERAVESERPGDRVDDVASAGAGAGTASAADTDLRTTEVHQAGSPESEKTNVGISMLLQSQTKFGIVTVLDDYDVPEDSPDHPDTAAMEPILIPYSYEFLTENDAKTFVIEHLRPWQLYPIDIVGTNAMLKPTEIDYFKLEEEFNSSIEELTPELQALMNTRKKEYHKTKALAEKWEEKREEERRHSLVKKYKTNYNT